MKNILKSAGWILLTFFLQTAMFIILLLIYAAVHSADSEKTTEQAMNIVYLATIISDIIIVAIALMICKAKGLNPVSEWKLYKLPPNAYIVPCVAAFCWSAFYLLIINKTVVGSALLLMAISLLAVSPVANEIIKRGIILNTLKRSFSAKNAIIISAVIFGLIRLPASGILAGIDALVICIIMAIIYEKTGSLWVGTAAHTAANLPYIILYILPEIPNPLRIGIALAMLATSAVSLMLWAKPKKS